MENKKKKWMLDIAIGIGLVVYIYLTTVIFINHKRIVQLRKQLKTTVHNLQRNNTSGKSENIIAKQTLKNLEKNDADVVGHFKLGVHFMGEMGNERKAIKHFEKVLQVDPDNKNKKNIQQWLATLKKRHKRNQSQLMTNLANLKKFIKENPKHYSISLKKKQIEIIESQLGRNNSK